MFVPETLAILQSILHPTTEIKPCHSPASAVALAVALQCISSAYNSCHLSQQPTLILDTDVQHSYSRDAMYCRKWKETVACFLKRLISQCSHFLLLIQVDESLLYQ